MYVISTQMYAFIYIYIYISIHICIYIYIYSINMCNREGSLRVGRWPTLTPSSSCSIMKIRIKITIIITISMPFHSIPVAIPPRWWRWRRAHRSIGQLLSPKKLSAQKCSATYPNPIRRSSSGTSRGS